MDDSSLQNRIKFLTSREKYEKILVGISKVTNKDGIKLKFLQFLSKIRDVVVDGSTGSKKKKNKENKAMMEVQQKL